jgi:hypothetical protein
MPLRRTQRSNGRPRPRWKDGSHFTVENTRANKSRCNEIALEPNRQTEPLVTVPQLLTRSDENNVSTRDRLARTGADARIKESAAMGELRLALRPYGRQLKLRFRQCPIIGILLSSESGANQAQGRNSVKQHGSVEKGPRAGAFSILPINPMRAPDNGHTSQSCAPDDPERSSALK